MEAVEFQFAKAIEAQGWRYLFKSDAGNLVFSRGYQGTTFIAEIHATKDGD